MKCSVCRTSSLFFKRKIFNTRWNSQLNTKSINMQLPGLKKENVKSVKEEITKEAESYFEDNVSIGRSKNLSTYTSLNEKKLADGTETTTLDLISKFPVLFINYNIESYDNLSTPNQIEIITHYIKAYTTANNIDHELSEVCYKQIKILKKKYKTWYNYHSLIQVCHDIGIPMPRNNIVNSLKNEKQISIAYQILLIKIYNSNCPDVFYEFVDILRMADGSNFDINTYALLFSCIGFYSSNEHNTDHVKYFLDLMQSQGITIEKLFSDGCFIQNDSHYAEKAIGKIHKNIKSSQPILSTYEYKNRLLKSLNEPMIHSKNVAIESPTTGVVNKEDMMSGYKKQIDNEKSDIILIKSIYKDSSSNQNFKRMEEVEKIIESGIKQCRVALRHQQEFLKNTYRSKSHSPIYPYLICLEEDEYMEVLEMMMRFMQTFSDGFSAPLHHHYYTIGNAVFKKYESKYSMSKDFSGLSEAYDEFINWYDNREVEGGGFNPGIKMGKLWKKFNLKKSIQTPHRHWSKEIRYHIGKILLNLLINNVIIEVKINGKMFKKPAFSTVVRTRDNRSLSEIKPCAELIQLQKSSPYITFTSDIMPMFCPPVPWHSINFGGYITQRTSIYRLGNLSHKQIYFTETNKGSVQPILDSLSLLGSVPWKINTEMLDLLIQIFNDKGWSDIGIPVHTDGILKGFEKTIKAIPVYRDKLIEISKIAKTKNENYALWSECHLKLSLSNHFRNDIFWLPQNIDFRGRAYPIPPHLTHVSADAYRSLIMFAKAKRLGSKGLYWLKVHVANTTGLVKRKTLNDRLKFTEDNLDLIFDSADNPLDGQKWWVNGEDPCQTLAACKELTKALRSENPEDYYSHLPIHQDGSCNGLQHYAALGKDAIGAEAVNVKPSNCPQDVYSNVLDVVNKIVKEDATNGNLIAQAALPLLKRKLVKQTVMTSVYGVTLYGAMKQIATQLKDTELTEKSRHAMSIYLSKTTFAAIKHMFNSAGEIQQWFIDYANIICKSFNDEVSWYSPLGLPIFQPYYKTSKTKKYRTLSTVKQKNAFPPNYVHSLDATHMFLTNLYCCQKGITFASIHDCFWTHACDIDRMNKICREQFVELYSLPLLEDLKKYYDSTYKFSKEDLEGKLKLPKKGEFDINEVKLSQYFFS